MKTIIRLVVVAIVLHGTWRAGAAYWRYFQFQDGVQHTAQFSGARSDEELRSQVMTIAGELAIPLDPERVTVRRQDNHTIIDASYDDRIELLPRYYHPWQFTANADAFTIVPRND